MQDLPSCLQVIAARVNGWGMILYDAILQRGNLCSGSSHVRSLSFLYMKLYCHEVRTMSIMTFISDVIGIPQAEAVAMIIGGFCREVFNHLPQEFSQEVDQLMSLKLEGSVG